MRNLIGESFNRWTVLSFDHRNGIKYYWKCRCECGEEKNVVGYNLISGVSKSCGCYQKEIVARLALSLTKHGLCYHPIYTSWVGMIQRCTNPKSSKYKYYGLRGIKVCEKWLKFEGFRDDMLASWVTGLEIDRIDNDGDYCLDNCRWATRKEQVRNRRNTKYLTFNGETKCLSQWAEDTGISSKTLRARLNSYGWSIERALTTPVGG